MEVDPRLQISDLTDYQYQTSLAHQYNNNFAASSLQHVPTSYGQSPSRYYQSVRQDEPRSSSAASSRPLTSRPAPHLNQQTPERYDISTLYQPTSIPKASQGFNPGRPSKTIEAPNGRGDSSPGTVKREVRDPTTFVPPHLLAPLDPNPPNLKQWRERFFNIDQPLLLTEEQYLTYFPHIDNVYSHRSTQKYKRKPFVSHYWDCRLKGRPTGTPMNRRKGNADDAEKKKRKRKVRERDLCDVKIKVTEFFSTEELETLRKLGLGPDPNATPQQDSEIGELSFVLNGQSNDGPDNSFGILEPTQNYADGHPGAGGKKWYMVQRVSGIDKDGDDADGRDLGHKHTLDESDRIKKNSVQRWLLAREKEKKRAAKPEVNNPLSVSSDDNEESTDTSTPHSRFHASGFALQTLYSHMEPTANNLTFYSCSYCPFAQRVWIALELIGIPYQYIEVTEENWRHRAGASPDSRLACNISELTDCNPEGMIPCIKHNNFAVWESKVMMEYLEDLAMGQSIFQPAVGNAQLKAHSRLWVDFIDRRILPVFYALLLLPDTEARKASGDSYEGPIVHNPAERNLHANPEPQRYNDERYRMSAANDGRTYFSTREQCDLSSMPLSAATEAASGFVPSTAYSLRARTLIATLHTNITTLVNASHRTGPFFLGPTLSYVDIAFAPWIIRLSRVLSYYRGFPRPEVGTRWQAWCDAVESNEVIRRTVSEEKNYREVYGGAGYQHQQQQHQQQQQQLEDNADRMDASEWDFGWDYDQFGRVDYKAARDKNISFPEMNYARKLVEKEGFGLGGDVWGQIGREMWEPHRQEPRGD